MDWIKIINAIIGPRLRGAEYLVLTRDDLEAVANLAAVEAERSWRADGGRSLSSWVWFRVEKAVQALLVKAARELRRERDLPLIEPEPETEGGEPEIVAELETRAALAYFQARLDPADLRLLWLFHGQGVTGPELAERAGVPYPTLTKRLSRARKRANKLADKFRRFGVTYRRVA